MTGTERVAEEEKIGGKKRINEDWEGLGKNKNIVESKESENKIGLGKVIGFLILFFSFFAWGVVVMHFV